MRGYKGYKGLQGVQGATRGQVIGATRATCWGATRGYMLGGYKGRGHGRTEEGERCRLAILASLRNAIKQTMELLREIVIPSLR